MVLEQKIKYVNWIEKQKKRYTKKIITLKKRKDSAEDV